MFDYLRVGVKCMSNQKKIIKITAMDVSIFLTRSERLIEFVSHNVSDPMILYLITDGVVECTKCFDIYFGLSSSLNNWGN